MATSRSKILLEKSIAAMLSAIEIYNKPDFKYREETFSVLAINSWELLLKAKVLHLSFNKISSLFVYEHKVNKDGTKSKKKYRKKNRTGNYHSVSLFQAYDILTGDYGLKIDKSVRANLEALTEIRDNSIHFMNEEFYLSKKVQEIGTASLRNYVNAIREWFGANLDKYNFYLMPLSFFREFPSAHGVVLTAQEKNLIKYLEDTEKEKGSKEIKDYNFSLEMDIKFKKSKTVSGTSITITKDSEAVAVRLEEEDIRERFPWDYSVLITRLRKRYKDFKKNQNFNKLLNRLKKDPNYCQIRYLDPGNPKSQKKDFYNPNIFKEFDNVYTKA